jgi:hypothetical protein
MDNTTRTVYAAKLQTCQLLGIPLTLDPKSTLNEKFSVATSQALAANQIPSLGYVAIGNGGHRMATSSGGIAVPEPIQHRSTDAALYNHLPFVLRPIGSDLSLAEQANYAMRVQVTINSVPYYAYYLKRLDLSTVAATSNYNTVANNVTTTTTFVPNSSNLTPTPPALSASGTNVVSGDYVTASALVPWNFSAADVAELINVSNILYGSANLAIISEIALVTGVDRNIQASSTNNGTFTFKEVIAAQIAAFISTFHSMTYSSSGLNLTFNVGATEPLFTTTVVTA